MNLRQQIFLPFSNYVLSSISKNDTKFNVQIFQAVLNPLPHNPDFKRPKKLFENIAGKGENAGNQHFLLFPQRFLSIPKKICF